MIHNLLSLTDKIAKPKYLLILLIITALFPIVIFPLAGIQAERILDARFCYSATEAIQLLQSYSAAERSTYFFGALFIDVLYPVFYSLLLAGLLTHLLSKQVNAQSSRNHLRLLPFAAALFDLLENFTLALLLAGMDSPSTGLATAAAICTPIKWSLVFVSILLILSLFIKKFVTGGNK